MAGVHRHRAHTADYAQTVEKSVGAFGLPAQDVDLLVLTVLVLLLGVTLVLVRRHGRSVAE
jgi:hypothetical protein